MKIGNLVFNRYKIEKLLGKGGMGTVYLAKDSFLQNKEIAIKAINPALLRKKSPEIIHRFKKEFDIMSKFNHPNLVRVYDFEFQKESMSYLIVMEYIKGITLKEKLLINHTLNIDETIELIVKLSRAIGFLHCRNILYRDIKPENIILDQGNLKLMDFGLSDIIGMEENLIKGSFHYLAPETIKCKVDKRTDIFSLGALFYEMLIGNHLISESLVKKYINILTDKNLFKNVHDASLIRIEDKRIRKIIEKMTAYEINDRYASTADIIFDINTRLHKDYPIETIRTMKAFITESEFIGREKEFEILRSHLFSVNNPNKAVMVKGLSGIGKTKLFDEFRKLCIFNDIEFHQSNCYETTEIAYKTISNLISRIICRAEPNLLNKYIDILHYIMPNNQILKQIQRNNTHRIQMKKDLLHQSIISFITDYIQNRDGLMVFFINDIQWIDKPSMEIIISLITHNPREDKLRLYFSAKEESLFRIDDLIRNLRAKKFLRIISLSPFRSKDTEEYIFSIFGKNYLDKTIKTAIPDIKKIAGGNPFFLKELLKKLINDGLFQRLSNSWSLRKNLSDIEFPENLLDITRKRISYLNLSDQQIQILLILSLLEMEIDLDVLFMLIKDIYDEDILSYLDLLQRNEIIVSNIKDNAVHYSLSHDLIRHILKSQIPEKEPIHEFIANRFERIFSDKIDNYLEVITFHYKNSNNEKKKLKFTLLAGNKAKKNFENEKALDYYNDFLSLSSDKKSRDSVSCKTEISNILFHIGKTSDALLILKECLSDAIRLGDKILISNVRRGLASIYRIIGDIEESNLQYNLALKSLEPNTDDYMIANIYGGFASNYFLMQDFDKSLQYSRKAYDIFIKHDEASCMWILNNIAIVYYQKGDLNRALQYHNEKLALAQKYNDIAGLGSTYLNIGIIYSNWCKFDKAMDYYNRSLKIERQLGNKSMIMKVVGNLGNIYLDLEEYEKALACFYEKYEIADELHLLFSKCNVLGNMGCAYLYMGDFQKAGELFSEKLKLAKKLKSKGLVVNTHSFTAELLISQGKFSKALIHLKKAIGIALKTGEKVSIGNLYGMMGQVYGELENYDLSEEYLKKAIYIFRHINYDYYLIIFINLLTDILLLRKNYIHAEKYNNEAMDKHSSINLRTISFNTLLLNARILSHKEPSKAKKLFSEILKTFNKDREKAEIFFYYYYYIKENYYKISARNLYKELYNKTPLFVYKKRLSSL